MIHSSSDHDFTFNPLEKLMFLFNATPGLNERSQTTLPEILHKVSQNDVMKAENAHAQIKEWYKQRRRMLGQETWDDIVERKQKEKEQKLQQGISNLSQDHARNKQDHEYLEKATEPGKTPAPPISSW